MLLQVDNGNICAFWSTALIELLTSKHNTNPSLGCATARILAGTLYVYTTAIAPSQSVKQLALKLQPVAEERAHKLPCGIPANAQIITLCRLLLALAMADLR